nr:hypothetical protein [Actinomycetota bacterium]
GDVETIFHEPRHPYTLGLMDSLPRVELEHSALRPIPGQPPSMISVPPGCPFHPRCDLYQGREICRQQMPPLEPNERSDHLSACHFSHELRGVKSRVIEQAARSVS